ncbi:MULTISPECIES: UbiA family prenyltransferase [Nocardiaceae]|uniref:4-hydroxybenzoate polyprenyltransferase n=1 Tax=Rhodococcoides corynebacterioides TaxID=53972 RepID=A0ABS2KX38_9NOCA|nr:MULTISPECIES: UbiA family prenyltransferase [Rhodococcus]MBM7416488.1 4-hydroxybenzoate polyprenyltransferase [Rhodococcus corynebacterioides]MBP1114741.1 4-hydroxybenzoate polyprenyltransferase [Rhodococcus sp. PvP016]
MGSRLSALLVASHPGPAAAVTSFVALLSVSIGPPSAGLLVVVVVAVLSGQLIVGWTNDLIDAPRDTAVGRTDKPLAVGRLDPTIVRVCVAVAAVVCVVFSMLCGVVPGAVHLVLGVGSALAYNLGLKSTVVSWLPYTVAFGSAPVVVSLTVADAMPPWWMITVGALLGFGAHLVNVLPDIADDTATGVRGLAHRLPARVVAPLAAGVLVTASIVGVVGSGALGRTGATTAAGIAALAVVIVAAWIASTGSGRTPFRAAIVIAGVTVLVLLLPR